MSFWGRKAFWYLHKKSWLVRGTFSLRSGAAFIPWWAHFCSLGAPQQGSPYSPHDIQSPHQQGLALLSYKCRRVFLYNLSLSSDRPKGKSVTGWMSGLWTGCCLVTSRAVNSECSQSGGVTEPFVLTQRPGSCFLPAAAWVYSPELGRPEWGSNLVGAENTQKLLWLVLRVKIHVQLQCPSSLSFLFN